MKMYFRILKQELMRLFDFRMRKLYTFLLLRKQCGVFETYFLISRLNRIPLFVYSILCRRFTKF